MRGAYMQENEGDLSLSDVQVIYKVLQCPKLVVEDPQSFNLNMDLYLLQEEFYLSVFIFPDDPPSSLGEFILKQWGFPDQYWWVWVCVGAMVVCTIIFNLIGYLALAYLPRENPFPHMFRPAQAYLTLILHVAFTA